MNFQKNNWLFVVVGIVIGALVMHFCSNYTIAKKSDYQNPETQQTNVQQNKTGDVFGNSHGNISELSAERNVINYVKENHRLPDFYITKNEARKLGWNASAGNLCDVLPGKVIGGDKFSNREKHLPSGDNYFEADVNYACGNRGADRIIFTKSGDVWLTKNHYKSFVKQ